MNTINAENCLFLIIDIQEKLVKMLNDNSVKDSAIKLAKTAKILNIPVIITEQYPKGLGTTIEEIKSELPNADYIEKTAFSAFYEIKSKLETKQKKHIIIFGIETHICVLQTAFDLLNNGYEVFVVKNASGSRNNENKETALRRLIHANSQIVTDEMVIFELLKTSRHPDFKEVQAIIK